MFDYKSGTAIGIRGTSPNVKTSTNAGNDLVKSIRSGMNTKKK